MKKIGIYGGSFDPVHHGHLILAREARETLALDEIFFVLAAQSPFKAAQQPANVALRWEMLEAAIGGERGFSASRFEIDRSPPSFSVDTVEQFQRDNPDAEIFFLIGEDNLPTLTSWHRFTALQRIVQFVVLERSGLDLKYEYPAVRRKIDISATAIRNRVASGQSIRYLVPEAVEAIIRRENLYQETKR